MTRDELEFQISQYLDGTLSSDEMAALQERLASDADARRLLAEYRRLNEHLARALPLPAVNWGRLAEHLSSVVADADAPVVAGRIGPAGWSWRSRLAIAASILIAASAGLLVYNAHRLRVMPASSAIHPANSSVVVIGPQVEPATGPVVQQITVGPSPELAAKGNSWRYAEGVVTRPSSATISEAVKPPSAHVR